MADWDWSGTPVGPPDTWPAGLRSMVRVLLSSRFSMWMAWGPELAFFYNDAYQHDTLQAKHPWALGRPAREVWAEIWDDVEPRIRSVLDTGVATWDEDLLLFLQRSGYPEETYHTFSYSPLTDERGHTEGMLCVVTENTRRVLSERRMATLRDLAAAVTAARTQQVLLGAVRRQLASNAHDLPFTLTYLFRPDGSAELACATGLSGDSAVAPRSLLPDDVAPWPVAALREGRPVLQDDVGARFPGLPTGAWAVPPTQLVAVPFSGTQGDEAAGFLAVGLNPHRDYDDAYRGFVELLASQISSGLLNAGSYEAERRRAESLAEIDRAKTDFFSNVSHEFRTPLTLIMGPVAELRAAPAVRSDERLRDELDTVHRNAQRLGRLVNTLLDFSRLQAGRITARFEPVDLPAFTADLASVFRSAVERAGLSFTVDCPPAGEPTFVDRDMWEKVVLNLLSNALKHTFEGGISVGLRAGEGPDDGAVLLTVEDTGTGIPAAELPRLFERFHRVEGVRARSGEGSGIGLAMVHELVQLHGGRITADSTPGLGTRLTVAVPRGRAHLPADRVAGTSADLAVSPAAEPFVAEALRWLPDDDNPSGGTGAGDAPAALRPASEGRVLVADDNADMREYLSRLLSGRYTVQLASDGTEALAAALADPPDLVVSDVMMPGLDGMGLLSALRSDARTERVPVLLLSARAGQEAAVEGLSAGADDYLVKPFSARELLARVGAHLQLGRVRRDAEQRFTAMADVAPALIWVSDVSGRRTFLNSGWQHFTGRAADDDLGRGWESLLHPQDRERYLGTVSAATTNRGGWEVEFRLRRADGAYAWLLERAVPIGDGDFFGGHVGSCTDINARYRETERQTLLASVGAALGLEAGIDQQLRRLARLTVDLRLADLCVVRRVGSSGELRIAGVAALDESLEEVLAALQPEPDMGRTAAEGRSVLYPQVPDDWPSRSTAADPEQSGLQRRLGVRSAVVVPLAVRGRVLAVLAIGRGQDALPYNEDDRALADEIAERAALSLDNALLLAEERSSAGRLALLQQATAQLSAATTPLQVARTTAAHVQRLVGRSAEVSVFEIDGHGRGLTALTMAGFDDDARERWSTIPLSAEVPVTVAVAERTPVWFEDVLRDGDPQVRRFPGVVRSLIAHGARAGVALPLMALGRVVGVIGLGFAEPRTISTTERETLLALSEQCAQALDRARLYRAERSIAETLQRSLLPQRLPDLDRLSLAARYLPGAEGTQAGGDWFDVVELDPSRVAIAVGDVVGQGPAAAAVMGQLRSSLSTALLDGHSPAAALELLDRFAARLPGAVASTAACLVLDRERQEVRWARAGHLPPLLLTDDGAQLLDSAGSGTVLGVHGRPPYTEGIMTVEPGSSLLLYTDGLVERRGENLDAGLDRLVRCAEKHGPESADRLAARLLEEILADGDPPDDIALIVARLLPAPLTERRPAVPTQLSLVRRAVHTWARATGLPDELIEDLELAVNEAAANAVEHAYPGDAPEVFEYSLAHGPGGDVLVRVADTGTWRMPPSDRGHRGRGLALIDKLAADLVVERAASGTVISFRLPAPDAGRP